MTSFNLNINSSSFQSNQIAEEYFPIYAGEAIYAANGTEISVFNTTFHGKDGRGPNIYREPSAIVTFIACDEQTKQSMANCCTIPVMPMCPPPTPVPTPNPTTTVAPTTTTVAPPRHSHSHTLHKAGACDSHSRRDCCTWEVVPTSNASRVCLLSGRTLVAMQRLAACLVSSHAHARVTCTRRTH